MVSKGDFDPKYFNYGDAYDNLWSAGCHDPDEIYEYRTYGGLDSFLGEYGFRVKDFYKEPSGPASREEDESGSNEGCFLSGACVHARNLRADCPQILPRLVCEDASRGHGRSGTLLQIRTCRSKTDPPLR